MAGFKGSILEINDKKVIVMTDKCDFITIKRTPDMYLGQQLTFSEAKSSMRRRSYIRNMAFAASVFVLALFSILYLQVFNSGNAFAYIDVDINPSMEFVVDDASRVLSVKALNSDAVLLLRELKLEDMPVKAAIAKVLDSSTASGYISPDKINEVLISATLESAKNSSAAAGEKTLSVILSDIESLSIKVGSENLHPKVLKVAPQVRKEAVENDISMGRYELYKEINKNDKKITIEKAKTEHISKMLDKAERKKTEKNDKAKNVNNSNLIKKEYNKSQKPEAWSKNSRAKEKDKEAINRKKPSQHGSPGNSRKSVKSGDKTHVKPHRQRHNSTVKTGGLKKAKPVKQDNSKKISYKKDK